MLTHVWHSFYVLKRIGFDLLKKQNVVLEKVVDNEELMECIRGNPDIYVPSSKILNLIVMKKNAWKQISSALRIHIGSA